MLNLNHLQQSIAIVRWIAIVPALLLPSCAATSPSADLWVRFEVAAVRNKQVRRRMSSTASGGAYAACRWHTTRAHAARACERCALALGRWQSASVLHLSKPLHKHCRTACIHKGVVKHAVYLGAEGIQEAASMRMVAPCLTCGYTRAHRDRCGFCPAARPRAHVRSTPCKRVCCTYMR